jgi:hypothetical protein
VIRRSPKPVGLFAAFALAGAAIAPAQGGGETGAVELGGRLLSAWVSGQASEGTRAVWLLTRPAREAAGARSLLRFTIVPEPELETIATGLDSWMKTLGAIDLGAGPELVAGGGGKVAAFGVAAGPGAAAPSFPVTARALIAESGVDLGMDSAGPLRTGLVARFHAVAPGRIEIWEPDGRGGVRAAAPIAIPFTLTRAAGGLRRSSPPVRPALGGRDAAWLFVGPESLGHLRVRGSWIDPANSAGARTELWAALPGPEKVEQSWPARIGSTPVLIVRTQAADEMNIFEKQRLRVLPLVEDRTRAGAKPTLAVELDSKRWHDSEVALADVDGDGLEDLVVAYPEGLSGDDLVAQVWRGRGAGGFDARARRSDVEGGGGSWRLVASTEGAAILLLREGQIELRRFSATGKALAERPDLAALVDPPVGGRKKKTVTVTAGGSEETVEVEEDEPETELLGAVELDGRPGLEALALAATAKTGDSLLFVRRP